MVVCFIGYVLKDSKKHVNPIILGMNPVTCGMIAIVTLDLKNLSLTKTQTT
jgi:hypothetical protein